MVRGYILIVFMLVSATCRIMVVMFDTDQIFNHSALRVTTVVRFLLDVLLIMPFLKRLTVSMNDSMQQKPTVGSFVL